MKTIMKRTDFVQNGQGEVDPVAELSWRLSIQSASQKNDGS